MIRIITDSASDISQEEAAAWNITVIPLIIRFDMEEFEAGVTLSNEEFFHRLLETDVYPSTSQITPDRYEKLFREAKEAGDEVILLSLPAKLSGSFQNALLAAQGYEDMVTIIDSGQVCLSFRILVEQAVRYRDAGMSRAEITERMQQDIEDTQMVAVLDTLEYVKRGGRINAATALVGGMLSVKPVLTVRDGEVIICGKARGTHNGSIRMVEFVEKAGGIDFDRPCCFGYTGFTDTRLQRFIADSRHLYDGHEDEMKHVYVGPTIGTYAGADAFAVAFFPKKG